MFKGQARRALEKSLPRFLVVQRWFAGKAWPLNDLSDLLRKYGPQLISWTKTHNGASYGHCSALIGTDDAGTKAIIHDPENAPNTRMTLANFNKLFMWNIPDSMLRKDVAAHTPKLAPKGA